METLDVTQIEPRLKHPTIFDRFDQLSDGGAFIIHNDHDPKPLYYQLIAERGEVFDWEYLEEGPTDWEVKISKLLKGEVSKTVGELVAEDYRKVEVFRKFGIDFCCGGNKSLKDACDKKGVDVDLVERELTAIESKPKTSQTDFKSWELDFLADYIVNTHHKYVSENIPMIYEFATKVARVHGDNHSEVIEIANLFSQVSEELRTHMQKEENILFPYVKKIVNAKKSNTALEPSPFGTIANPINMMESEHEFAGGHMDRIRLLSDNFTPPADACTSYRVLYAKLEEFENDLHQHIHLENNILFPKAIELEKELI